MSLAYRKIMIGEFDHRQISYFVVCSIFIVVANQFTYSVSDFSDVILCNSILSILSPLVPVFVIYFFYSSLVKTNRFDIPISYVLFFAISATSYVGLTETLDGSHAESKNYYIFGLSFYTATLAFHIMNRSLDRRYALLAANPLTLITGPVMCFFRWQTHKRFRTRVRYYFPFVLLGLFLHQAVATPLTETFDLLEKTDAVSSISFAIIFEFFVYSNFCGMSLMIFGLAGIFGMRVPLNFKQPFSSTNLIDFWKGWHLSLSMTLKTLFYLPIRQRWGTYAAVAAVYMCSAFWHGVTFNFLLWGGVHAFAYMATLFLLRRKVPFLPLVILVVAMLFGRLVYIDTIPERLVEKLAFDFDGWHALSYIASRGGAVMMSIGLITLFIASEFLLRRTRYFRQRMYKFYRLPVVQVALLVITLMSLSANIGIDYAVYGQR